MMTWEVQNDGGIFGKYEDGGTVYNGCVTSRCDRTALDAALQRAVRLRGEWK